MACSSPLQNILRLKIFSRKLFQLGDLDVLYASDGVFIFTRKLESQIALVAVNSVEQERQISVVTEPRLLLTGVLGGTIISDEKGVMIMNIEGLSSQLYINSSPHDLVV